MAFANPLEYVKGLVRLAWQALPGATGWERRDWVLREMRRQREMYDGAFFMLLKLPVLAAAVDFPAVDRAQDKLDVMILERALAFVDLNYEWDDPNKPIPDISPEAKDEINEWLMEKDKP